MKVIALLLIAATTLSLGACSESNEEIQQRSEGIVAGDNTSSSNQIASERIIYRGDPPYLTNQPILDGKLHVNNTDDYLLFGGENIEEIRFSASKRSGGKATTVFRETGIGFLMDEQPYIEFSYHNKFYSLQILSRPYFYTMDFREIPSATIQLSEGYR